MDVKVVLPLVRTHASIIAGSAPNAVMTLTGIPSDSRSTLTNQELRINAQLRLGLPLASCHNNRMHRARMAASTRRPRSPSRCGTVTNF